jgi:hypothetical protein
MKGILLISILSIILFSCSKPLDDRAFEVFQLQRVNKYSHYYEDKDIVELKYFEKNIFEADVILDTSLFVHCEGSYQNKLLGFYEDQIHKNSARVSYHTISASGTNKSNLDSLEFKAYVYNNGVRNTTENPVLLCLSRNEVKNYLEQGKSIRFSIEVTKDNYVFKVDAGENINVSRSCNNDISGVKYLCYHYYGGPDSIAAPHNMDMWIKYCPSMK